MRLFALFALTALVSCGPEEPSPAESSAGGGVYVVNYPLQYFAERIANGALEVHFLAPPGVDDYAILANELLGLQAVDVTDPRNPIRIVQAPHLVGALRVLVETQQMDRFIDEQGNPLKENSHPFVEVFTRDDVVRILSTSIECDP